jgi:hypothetical protein
MRASTVLSWVALWALGFVHASVRARTGVVGVGVVYHTLAEPEDYLLDVILIRAYLCDVVLNDVLCDNHQDFHVLGANKCQIIFGVLCQLANGISYPLLLIVSV